jgi:branched-chain amino acid transport system substrate-binding protein
MRRRTAVSSLLVAGALALAACSSSGSNSGGGSTSASGSKPIRIGGLASLTGVAASSNVNCALGIKARIGVENDKGGINGHKLEYVMADDKSEGPGVVAAITKLVEQEHVFGIVTPSSYFAAGAAKAAELGVPVAGVSYASGDYWFKPDKYPSIFDAYGYGQFSLVATTWGKYFKSIGATKVGAIGYGASPSSSLAAEESVESAKAVGLQAGYLDTSLAFGTTDVGAIVQKIKASGTDALYVPVVPSTGYALVKALRQAGVQLKSVVLATGYGQTVLDDPATREASKGIDFYTVTAPIESKNPRILELQSALAKYSGAKANAIPTFDETVCWLTTDLFITGLKLPGADASKEAFVTELRKATWDGAGITTPTNFADIKPAAGGHIQGNCFFVTRFDGNKFVPQDGAGPVCGEIVPGVTLKT